LQFAQLIGSELLSKHHCKGRKMIISKNLQDKYDREDFEHSKASKLRSRIELCSLGFLTIALIAAIAGALQ
jgi:hypothetical protein